MYSIESRVGMGHPWAIKMEFNGRFSWVS